MVVASSRCLSLSLSLPPSFFLSLQLRKKLKNKLKKKNWQWEKRNLFLYYDAISVKQYFFIQADVQVTQ